MTRTEVALLTTLFNLLLIGLFISRTDLAYFEQTVVIEDGLVETVSVVALVAASAVCGYRLFRLRGERSPLFLACVALLGALFIFGAGEEISWGQRIFGVESPEFFQKNNSQAETNLHNLVLGGVRINKLVFGTILAIVVISYVLILPQLYKRVARVRAWVDALAIPVPRPMHALVYILAYAIVALVHSKRGHGELLELTGCVLFLLIVLYPANRPVFLPKTTQG